MKNMVTDEIVLPPQLPKDLNKKTLILDLDETLVHSSFSPLDSCDLILPVSQSKFRLRSTIHVAMFTFLKDQELMSFYSECLSILN